MDNDNEKAANEEPTPEEKAAAKKAAKKAAAAKKAQLKALREHAVQQDLKRDHFEREKAFVTTTNERASADWESMVCDIQHKAERQELDALWSTLTHTIDRKTNLIERLGQDVQNAKEQYKRLAVSHVQFIEQSNGSKCQICI